MIYKLKTNQLDGLTADLWTKVEGKERIYFTSSNGKKFGYYDINSGAFVKESAWSVIGQKERLVKKIQSELLEQVEGEIEPSKAALIAKQSVVTPAHKNDYNRNFAATPFTQDEEYWEGDYRRFVGL